MKETYIIEPFDSLVLEVEKGHTISLTAPKGYQPIHFFAEYNGDTQEFLSPAVTALCNHSLKLKANRLIFSNHYRPLFEVVVDDSAQHDLISPLCYGEHFRYYTPENQAEIDCLTAMNQALGENRREILPLNLFLKSKVKKRGTYKLRRPMAKPGDTIMLKAMEDVKIVVTPCRCKYIKGEANPVTPVEVIIRSSLF